MGQLIWEHALDPGDIAVTPTVSRGQVVVGVDPQPATAAVNQVRRWYVRALSVPTGDLVWQHTSEPAPGARVTSVECDDALTYVSSPDGMVALERATGAVRWSRAVRHPMPTRLHDGLLHTSSRTELLVLDPDTGTVLRRRRCGGDPRAVTVGPDRSLFVSTHNSRVLRLDPDTLDLVRTYPVPGRWAVGAPVALSDDGSTVVVNSHAGFLLAFDAETGAVRWRRRKATGRQGRVWTVPDDGVLSTTPDLVLLDAGSGRPRWSLPGEFVFAVPHAGRVHGLSVTGGRFEHVMVDRDTGNVLGRDDWGTAPPHAVNWSSHGFALSDSGGHLAVTAHDRGRVAAVRF